MENRNHPLSEVMQDAMGKVRESLFSMLEARGVVSACRAERKPLHGGVIAADIGGERYSGDVCKALYIGSLHVILFEVDVVVCAVEADEKMSVVADVEFVARRERARPLEVFASSAHSPEYVPEVSAQA